MSRRCSHSTRRSSSPGRSSTRWKSIGPIRATSLSQYARSWDRPAPTPCSPRWPGLAAAMRGVRGERERRPGRTRTARRSNKAPLTAPRREGGSIALRPGPHPGHRDRRGRHRRGRSRPLTGAFAAPLSHHRRHPRRPARRSTGSTPRSGSAATPARASWWCCGSTAPSPITAAAWSCRCCCADAPVVGGGPREARTTPSRRPDRRDGPTPHHRRRRSPPGAAPLLTPSCQGRRLRRHRPRLDPHHPVAWPARIGARPAAATSRSPRASVVSVPRLAVLPTCWRPGCSRRLRVPVHRVSTPLCGSASPRCASSARAAPSTSCARATSFRDPPSDRASRTSALPRRAPGSAWPTSSVASTPTRPTRTPLRHGLPRVGTKSRPTASEAVREGRGTVGQGGRAGGHARSRGNTHQGQQRRDGAGTRPRPPPPPHHL